MGSNSLTPTPITGGTKLTGEYENSDWLGRFGPDIDFTLEVKRTGDLLDIRYIGDGFPSVGFWRGYNGSWGNGIVLAEQTEWSLFGTADVACRFVLR